MFLETMVQRFRKARVTNADDNGFPTRGDIIVVPTYTGATAAQAANYALSSLANLGNTVASGRAGPNALRITPYAVGADNATFSMRVYAVDRIFVADNPLVQYTWNLLAEFACTASTAVGKAAGLVVATERYADTITLTYPTASIPSIEIQTNAANLAGWVKVDLAGAEDYEITFTTGGSATSCNALVKEF
jgi:hypothetical protein